MCNQVAPIRDGNIRTATDRFEPETPEMQNSAERAKSQKAQKAQKGAERDKLANFTPSAATSYGLLNWWLDRAPWSGLDRPAPL